MMNGNCQLNMMSIIEDWQQLSLHTEHLTLYVITDVFVLVTGRLSLQLCKFINFASSLKCLRQEVKVLKYSNLSKKNSFKYFMQRVVRCGFSSIIIVYFFIWWTANVRREEICQPICFRWTSDSSGF